MCGFTEETQSNPHFMDPLNMDTSLLWTVCFVPGERKLLRFLLIQPA